MNIQLKRPIVRYHGGKWLIAPWILRNMPKHKTYTEVFGGGASVLLRKHISYAEIYNDQWDVIVNVFRVMRDRRKSEQLKRLLELTPYSRTEYANAIDKEEDSDIERARKTLIRSYMGFGSASINENYSTGFRSSSSRSGTTPAHDWRNYPNKIEFFVHRLKNVTIENRPYYKVFEQHDRTSTLHYVDPPYVPSTRSTSGKPYAFDFTEENHIELANYLHELKGMVMLSGYESELYKDLFPDWLLLKKKGRTDNSSKSKQECLWLNPLAARLRPQRGLFCDQYKTS